MIEDDVEQVLDCYFKACSISVNSKDLAHIGFVLANRGKLPQTEERIFPSRYATYVNAILMTCGMYDGSGDFAVNVGVPAKSGVGGGIMAVVPTRMGIGIFSPGLDGKGNSLAAVSYTHLDVYKRQVHNVSFHIIGRFAGYCKGGKASRGEF